MAYKSGKGRKKRNGKLKLKLLPKDRKRLKELMSKGRESVRVVKRARILQLLDAGKSGQAAAEAAGAAIATAYETAWRYEQGGFNRALRDAPRPGKAPALNDKQRQKIVAMVCSAPPAGFARWSVRLIVEEVRKRKLVPRVGRETVRVLLKSHHLKPWREKNVVHS
ncbi:MAG: helix-turn-helix domain-containing protein [Elusimicrobia bacterium]|nr:helix-turn-helix domain-containing protein [Elusimicrobiota bacterium]